MQAISLYGIMLWYFINLFLGYFVNVMYVTQCDKIKSGIVERFGLIFLISSKKLSFVTNVLDINIMRQSACLVFNPITVNNFASLFNCTPVGRASDSMMAPT